jgi:hypothetical protein
MKNDCYLFSLPFPLCPQDEGAMNFPSPFIQSVFGKTMVIVTMPSTPLELLICP